MIKFFKDWICLYENKFIKKDAITKIVKNIEDLEDPYYGEIRQIIIHTGEEYDIIDYKTDEAMEADFAKLKEWLGCEEEEIYCTLWKQRVCAGRDYCSFGKVVKDE